MNPETLAVRSGRRIDNAIGAVSPPIHLSSTFEKSNDGDLFYSRIANPNRTSLEECLCSLEDGAEAIAFGSGMAAISSVFQSLSTGDHVIIADDVFCGVNDLLEQLLGRWGLTHTIVDLTNLQKVKEALRSTTKLIWAETPSNPLLKVTDIQALSTVAKESEILLGVDSTWGTPLLQQPILLGADIVVHSTTKYLGGHSDLTGGIVVCKDNFPLTERIRKIQELMGGIPSPFDCFLLMRGISTLAVRMAAHCSSAQAISERLNEHPEVHNVNYPGLAQHRQHETARRQMRSFGGMLSFQVKGGPERAARVCRSVRLFTNATSLGSVDSLIEHRAPVEGPNTKTPRDLIRVSVGLEHPDDLMSDLDMALHLSAI